VPEVALNLTRGCGNPTGFAGLQSGEIVVDFGCGGGIDVVLAAHKVGLGGKVVGLDFAPEMIERASHSVAEAGLAGGNVELHVADLANPPLADGFADVVISNCVINLCPVKAEIYREACRVLKSGGRLAISDIVLTEDIDPELRERFRSTWPGCLGGAITEDDYWRMVSEAGFHEVRVITRHLLTPDELAAMACCPGKEFTPAPAPEELAQVQGKVASVKFTGIKSRRA
jgi:ubiquinone/menaquinone biosynthesis C-methylase UbiE